ncbi:glycosyltransferase family 2 protein [Schaalia sp. ZJ405]|nr:glycosyltransferase family 2 protein [Schaalia sp. ZJ405]
MVAPQQSGPRILDNPTVSVALCTHNGAEFIAAQVRSIIDQTSPVDEIVLGDDDSTDETVEIVERVLEGTPVRLRVRRHSPALRVRGNFSDAIGATTGDVVILCDQDDVWHPRKVETLVAAIAQGNDLVHSDARLVDASGDPLGTTLLGSLGVSQWEKRQLSGGDAVAVLLRRNLVTGATTALNGQFARAVMPVPEGWIHDEWMAMLAALRGRLRLLPVQLTDYRQHDNNEIGVNKGGLKGRLARLLVSDVDDDVRRLRRAYALESAVADAQWISADNAQRVREFREHQVFRAQLPKSRVLRLPRILAECVRGRYSRYSRGWLTVARDLLQVHGPDRRQRLDAIMEDYARQDPTGTSQAPLRHSPS